MKTTYEERGLKFAETLAKMFQSCVYLSDFVAVIDNYNASHSRKLVFKNGVSRIAIIRADYVIKFDYRPTGYFSDGKAGDCETELEAYEHAIEDGIEYLLAKPTVREMFGHTFSVMPRINHVGDKEREWWKGLSPEEEVWLENNINDLHDNNVGYKNGKVCVIDYAWHEF